MKRRPGKRQKNTTVAPRTKSRRYSSKVEVDAEEASFDYPQSWGELPDWLVGGD